MAYDEDLADRIRRALDAHASITEKKMFGGIAFLYRDKMFCGVTGADLMVRVGPAAYAKALTRVHVRPMDFTGKPMKGYVYVAAEGTTTVAKVRRWAEEALAFVSTLDDDAPSTAARERKGRPPR
jgi:TfoX/Sxy family transcriptional regulator of competence genes